MGSKEGRSGGMVNAVMAMYEGAQTVVRTTEGCQNINIMPE